MMAANRNADRHSGQVTATISPDGRVIASGDSAGKVRLWETSTGRLLDEFEAHTGRIRSLQFHPEGTMLATGGDDQRVRLWVLASGERSHEFDGYNDSTQDSIAFSPDGRTIAFACHEPSDDLTEGGLYHVELHEVSSGDLTARLPSSKLEIVGVHFSPDGDTLATTAREPLVRLWSTSGEPIGELAGITTAWTTTFSGDGRHLAAGTWGDRVQVWDLATRKPVKTLEGHSAVVYGVAYHPLDPRLLASASADGTVNLWDMEEQRSLVTLTPFDGYDAVTVAFSPDGRSLVVSGAHETVAVYDLTYYDRHIAGHIEYQIERLRPELGDSIQEERLLVWRDEVLRRPWPRLGPRAEQSDSPADALLPGVDPQIIAARRSNSASSNP